MRIVYCKFCLVVVLYGVYSIPIYLNSLGSFPFVAAADKFSVRHIKHCGHSVQISPLAQSLPRIAHLIGGIVYDLLYPLPYILRRTPCFKSLNMLYRVLYFVIEYRVLIFQIIGMYGYGVCARIVFAIGWHIVQNRVGLNAYIP